MHHRQDRENADTVGDEVGRVEGADHTLAEARGQPGLEPIERARIGRAGGDDLDQAHVARRVEEVDAAEARTHIGRERLRQRVDRQSGGVGSDDGIGRNVRHDLAVQVVLPVHALGDRLDDQLAAGQLGQMLIVVGGRDQLQRRLVRQRRRFELLQPVDGLPDDAVLVAFLRGQVEEDDRHAGIGEMRRDLRTHDPGAEYGGFLDMQSVHAIDSWFAMAVRPDVREWLSC